MFELGCDASKSCGREIHRLHMYYLLGNTATVWQRQLVDMLRHHAATLQGDSDLTSGRSGGKMILWGGEAGGFGVSVRRCVGAPASGVLQGRPKLLCSKWGVPSRPLLLYPFFAPWCLEWMSPSLIPCQVAVVKGIVKFAFILVISTVFRLKEMPTKTEWCPFPLADHCMDPYAILKSLLALFGDLMPPKLLICIHAS